MNSPYDWTESAVVITKLVGLTRDGKIEWTPKRSPVMPEMVRFQTSLDEESEAVIWSTGKEAGFRIFESGANGAGLLRSWESGDPMGNPPLNVQANPMLPRDLISIAINHASGPARGEIYVNLMSLVELARRTSDKVEPKIDRVKQYLDKLAV
jgi:hypothetical protein